MTIREDIIRILKDPSLVTVTTLVEYVEAQRADEREQHPSIFEVVQSTCGHRWVGSADEGVACPVCEDAGVMTRRALTDLVAALAALPSRVELDEVGNEVTWVRYTDVLALLGEERDRG